MTFELLLPLVLGWLLDMLCGDPACLPHPVVYMGKWISFWEHRLNKGGHRMLRGAVFAVCSIVLTWLLASAIALTCGLLLTWYVGGTASIAIWIAIMSVFVFFCLAGKTLRREVRWVFEALDRSLEEGRKQVSRIVGRDTQELSEQEVRAAALETLAENLSDGVVAPIFWYVVLGVPGMLMYKMINTLDSMIGYHSPRYKDFGCWAAHIDDIANYIPARITALLMVIVSTLHPRRLFHRLRFVIKYGPQHASPNSGWPEAALASILDCRFGGSHNYFGEVFYKPYIGHNPRELNTQDVHISLRICFAAECLTIIISGLILFAVLYNKQAVFL